MFIITIMQNHGSRQCLRTAMAEYIRLGICIKNQCFKTQIV